MILGQSVSTTIDLGQILVAGLIAVVGFLIKHQLSMVLRRIDRHDDMLDGVIREVATLVGIVGMRRDERDRLPGPRVHNRRSSEERP